MEIIHVNEIHLDGEDRWSKQFNLCSDYWQKSNDQSLPQEERAKYSKLWLEERKRLELGIY